MKMFKWSLRVSSLVVVSVIILFAFAGGYVFAAFNIGSFNTTFNQALSNDVPNAPTGVTFTSADVQVASLTIPVSTGICTSTDSSTATAPDALAAASIFVCLNSVTSGYASTDSIQTITITWGPTAPVSTTYELTIYIGGATLSSVKAYVKTPSTLSTAASAMIAFDLTSGLVTSVSSLSVLVSQCSGTTCP